MVDVMFHFVTYFVGKYLGLLQKQNTAQTWINTLIKWIDFYILCKTDEICANHCFTDRQSRGRSMLERVSQLTFQHLGLDKKLRDMWNLYIVKKTKRKQMSSCFLIHLWNWSHHTDIWQICSLNSNKTQFYKSSTSQMQSLKPSPSKE